MIKIITTVVFTLLLSSTFPTTTISFTHTALYRSRHHNYYLSLLSQPSTFSSHHERSPNLPLLSLSTSLSLGSDGGRTFDETQLDFTIGYLNKHHPDLLLLFAEVFTPLGVAQANKNSFSGGSYTIEDAKLVGLSYNVGEGEVHHDEEEKVGNFMELEVNVSVRGEKNPRLETVQVALDAEPNIRLKRLYSNSPVIPKPNNPRTANPIDDFIRRVNRLCFICHKTAVTGKLIQLGIQIGGEKVGLLKENMYLNQVPHNRYVRKYFYDMAGEAALKAVVLCSEGKISNRMKMTSMIPEMNPFMDAYRIGTLLELARAIAIKLAEQNLRVRVCVQGSMGVGIFTAVPKQLNGVATLLQRMDWESEKGEENEGMLGDYVNFGGIGKDHVVNAGTDRRGDTIEQDDVFLLLCPQSMIGTDTSIIEPLSEMTREAGDRPIILLNPDLVDKVSTQGQQSFRGRQERIDFAESFSSIYHFTNTYVTGTSYFPILGAIAKFGPMQSWIAYQRRDRIDGKGEVYFPILSTEEEPSGAMMKDAFE